MYEWTFGINGMVIIGRKWEEFIYLINTLVDILKLSSTKRLIIYTHYLQHEFEYMRKWLTWTKVFASEPRKPIYALTENGIEFRCSYMLSGYSLEKLGEQLHTYQIKKLPLTKTSYVRNYCREKCFKSIGYKSFIHSLTLSPDEYNQLKRAFQGGFTHANPFISNLQIPIENVTSYDITSSYP